MSSIFKSQKVASWKFQIRARGEAASVNNGRTSCPYPRFAAIMGVLCLGLVLLADHPVHAASAGVSVDKNTIELDLRPSMSTGGADTGSHTVNVKTDCSSGYGVYASATASGDNKLHLDGNSSNTGATNSISASGNTMSSPSSLSANTWGVGTSSSAFSGVPAYSAISTTNQSSNPTALYTSSNNPGLTTGENKTVYYSANVNTNIEPGAYSGQVLYTVVMKSACYTAAVTTKTAGSGVASVAGAGTYSIGSEVTLGYTMNTGYHFVSWAVTTASGSTVAVANNKFTMPAENVTVTATGAANTYTIKYNANAPSETTATGTTSNTTGATYDGTVSLRDNGYSVDGYEFVGWAYSSSATDKNWDGGQTGVSVSTLAANNASGSVVDTNGGTINLYAVWRQNALPTLTTVNGDTANIASISDGGEYTPGTSITVTCTAGNVIGKHCGWSSSNPGVLADSSSSSYTFNMPSSNITLTANMVDNSYDIVYSAGSGTGTPSKTTETVSYSDTVVMPTASGMASPDSYHSFAGWNKLSGASGGTFSSGATVAVSTLVAVETNSNSEPTTSLEDGSTIKLYAAWNGTQTFSQAGLTSGSSTMQAMTSTICSRVKTGEATTLKDNRSGTGGVKSYKVRKLADGNCWMVQNLALYGITLSKTTSNTSGSFTLPGASATENFSPTATSAAAYAHYVAADTTNGIEETVYYNYYAATAGHSYYKDGNTSGGNTSYDICPASWKLPAVTDGTKSWNSLIVAYGGDPSGETNYVVRDKLRDTSGPSLVYAGYYSRNLVIGSPDIWGVYWGPSFRDSESGYGMYLDNNGAVSVADAVKYLGFPIRCIAK